ncbi:MAG: DMT family transporter [Pseudomonadota bacterium]
MCFSVLLSWRSYFLGDLTGGISGPPRSMRLFYLTSLTMIAFAGNSVLNRLAVGSGSIAPIDFALLRLVAGAVTLGVLLALNGKLRLTGYNGPGRTIGLTEMTVPIAGLLAYLFGFSLAYLGLDAGSGALILFGVVQVTMFAGALFSREHLPSRRWVGASLAFGGLTVMLWPTESASVTVIPALWMVLAGIGWGVYSLAGTRESDPLFATGRNFILGLLPALTIMVWFTDFATASIKGVILAILSGAVTSGLGYALWYQVLPGLGPSRAAIAQLSVPVIAALLGAALLAEPIGTRSVLAAVLVFSGVAVASLGPARRP